HVDVVSRGAAGQGEQRQRRETDKLAPELGQGGQSCGPVRTRNSVPRTPRIAAGVRTFIASGDCLASLPETTASVPCFSELSNAPWWVVVSKTKRSIESTLSGPTESRLLSRKVIPTEPSAPVITRSPCWTTLPTGAGMRWPERSICTAPFETLICPASSAAAACSTPIVSASGSARKIMGNFIASSSTSRASITFRNGRRDAKPDVYIVADFLSRASQIGGAHERSRRYRKPLQSLSGPARDATRGSGIHRRGVRRRRRAAQDLPPADAPGRGALHQ